MSRKCQQAHSNTQTLKPAQNTAQIENRIVKPRGVYHENFAPQVTKDPVQRSQQQTKNQTVNGRFLLLRRLVQKAVKDELKRVSKRAFAFYGSER